MFCPDLSSKLQGKRELDHQPVTFLSSINSVLVAKKELGLLTYWCCSLLVSIYWHSFVFILFMFYLGGPGWFYVLLEALGGDCQDQSWKLLPRCSQTFAIFSAFHDFWEIAVRVTLPCPPPFIPSLKYVSNHSNTVHILASRYSFTCVFVNSYF